MKAELVYCFRLGWHWLAQGDGPINYIVSEGDTREEAAKGWTELYGRQYEADARASAISLYMEENDTELRELSHSARNYKGIF